jgi:SAM-dependent methyltransferase
MQLLLGCGRSRVKKLFFPGREAWEGLVTMDMNPDVGADVVHDLTVLPLPFADDSAEEIHLYDVLEHTRQQGDWRGFFAEFSEFWRILRPGGHLFALCPAWNDVWAWGDPGHTRVIQVETLSYLSQAAYREQLDCAEPKARTDYRFVWKGDMELVHHQQHGAVNAFVLRAIKGD